VTDNRVLEVYASDPQRPRIVGAVQFNRASAAASQLSAHCGVVASAFDESFVWATGHIGGPGPTAWLEISFLCEVPLEETLYIKVELDSVEMSKSGRQKVRLQAQLHRLCDRDVDDGSVENALANSETLCTATTLLVSRMGLDPKFRHYASGRSLGSSRL